MGGLFSKTEGTDYDPNVATGGQDVAGPSSATTAAIAQNRTAPNHIAQNRTAQNRNYYTYFTREA